VSAARRRATGALAACLLAGLLGAPAPAPGALTTRAASAGPTTLLVFAPVDERSLASLPGMSVGILSAAEGGASRAQLQLDITQGARLGAGAYGSPPPAMSLSVRGSGGRIAGWGRALARTRSATGELRPGLLGSALAGAAYVAASGQDGDAPAAAGGDGSVAAVSLGPASTLAARARALLSSRRLVVATIPPGPEGRRALERLAASRGRGELMIVVQSETRSRPSRLLWVGAAGLGGRPHGELTSSDTQVRGLISSADIAPTILAHEQVPTPASVQGSPARVEGGLDGPALRGTIARLGVIGGRRLPALGWLLAVWALLLIACSRTAAARRWALRAGALGVLWAPVVAMLAAAAAPSAAVEYALTATVCPLLGALSDGLLGWPRALLAPAIACVAAITGDALAASRLLVRSLAGPDPALGARFHGVGNDLKAALAVLVLAAVAAGLHPSRRGRRAWSAMALSGAGLACVEGATRLGAGVGGVVIVCLSFALAVALLLDGARARRRAVIVVASPIVGLAVLAVIDLLSAHGSGQYYGSLLDAHSAGEVRELIVRRYEAAWRELGHGAMPLATAGTLAAVAAVLRLRSRVLGPVAGDPAWNAALYGSLTAGLLGALIEDSGPLLLVSAVFTGGCVLCYLWGRPRPLRRGVPGRARTEPAGSFPALAGPRPLPDPTPVPASGASVPPGPARPARAGASDAGR